MAPAQGDLVAGGGSRQVSRHQVDPAFSSIIFKTIMDRGLFRRQACRQLDPPWINVFERLSLLRQKIVPAHIFRSGAANVLTTPSLQSFHSPFGSSGLFEFSFSA